MKKALLTLGVMSIVIPPLLFAQPNREAQDTDNAVKRAAKWTSPHVVYQEFRGPVSQIDKNMKIFMDEFFKQGLVPTNRTSPPMGIFHETPKSADDPIRYDVGFTIQAKKRVRPPLKIRAITLDRAARYTHTGRYETLFDVHKNLDRSIAKAKLKASHPVIHLYLDNPDKVGVEKRRTEVLVPVGR